MMHRLIAALAVRHAISPDVLADMDPDLFNALVRRSRGIDPPIPDDELDEWMGW